MEKDKKEDSGIPLGLEMALAQNLKALQAFSSLTKAEQQLIIEKAHSVSSKQEMQALTDSIGSIG